MLMNDDQNFCNDMIYAFVQYILSKLSLMLYHLVSFWLDLPICLYELNTILGGFNVVTTRIVIFTEKYRYEILTLPFKIHYYFINISDSRTFLSHADSFKIDTLGVSVSAP